MPCGWIWGSKTEVKSPKICPKGGPKTKTAIFRKSCSRVHGSTIFEVRRPRKLSRNLRKTVTERRRKPRRVSGLNSHDFGAVLDLKKDPKSSKNAQKTTPRNRREKGGQDREIFMDFHGFEAPGPGADKSR